MKKKYVDICFRQASLSLIGTVNTILAEYQGQRLTLRQIYYQLVARSYIANTVKEYEHLSRLLTDARMAGLVAWYAIEDRTREFQRRSRWESGADILESAAGSFHMDLWSGQGVRPFCIVEKDALSGVLGGVCDQYDIPLLAAKGYASASTLREFAEEDILPAYRSEEAVVVFHLADHDPSGLDMTRDIEDRLRVFCWNGNGARPIKVVRLALNIDQVERFQPPPNPAKTTDRRFAEYREKYGMESWELDALKPEYLTALVETAVKELIDEDKWDERLQTIKVVRTKLEEVARDVRNIGGVG